MCANAFTVRGKYLKIQKVHLLQPPCPLNLDPIPPCYFECMQALPPRKLKAASKLIFMNGGFGGCHLFDSIHRIGQSYRAWVLVSIPPAHRGQRL
nr:unnamed protein product [Gossypium raimondii]